WPLVVDDEPEIRFVEPHPKGDRRHERLQFVRDQRVFEVIPFLGRKGRVIGTGVDPLRSKERGDPLAVGDREAVDDPAAWHLGNLPGEPGKSLRLVRQGYRVKGE